MNHTHKLAEQGDDGFVNLVTFKWLMAGLGWWVELSRLERDSSYAQECLRRAIESNSRLLREHGIELLGQRFRADS